MSSTRFTIFAAAAVFDKRLSLADKAVLAAFGAYNNTQAGWCYPSQATLCDRLDIARSTLSAAIKKLVTCGYLEVRARTRSGKGKVGNEYRVKTDINVEVVEKPPMSDGVDIGEKPMSMGTDIGSLSACKKPMSDGADIGADVHGDGHPMSDGMDIGIYIDERAQLTGLDSSSLRSEESSPSAQAKAARDANRDHLALTAPEAKPKPAPKRPPKRKFVACDESMPDALTPRMLADAAKFGFVNGSATALFERWRDHHIAKATPIADIEASWRVWCANEVKFSRARAPAAPPPQERDYDPLQYPRFLCRIRLEKGEWPAGRSEIDIPNTVRREFPALFVGAA